MTYLTVSEFITALGGTTKAAAIFDVTPPAVSNWRASGELPAKLHLKALRLAEKMGIAFDPDKQGKRVRAVKI